MLATKRLTLEELIDLESREIAKEILEKRLAEQDLPLPESGLDIHLDQLIRINPSIVQSARARVEMRLDAYSKALKAIGIDPTPIESMEL
jgi:hypothetical protein